MSEQSTALVPFNPDNVPRQREMGPRELGEVFARSKLFADSKDAAQAITKVLAGRELGIAGVASMTGVYIVKGRVTLSANLMAAVIQNSGRFRFRVLKHSETECQIRYDERDPDSKKWETVGTSVFTIEDAKKGGLAGSDTYRKFPRNMLYARAMSNGAKWYCPSCFAGHTPYTPDELEPARARMRDDGEYVIDAEVVESAQAPETISVDLETRTAELKSKLETLIEETGSEEGKLCAFYGVFGLDSLSETQLRNAISLLSLKPKVKSKSESPES